MAYLAEKLKATPDGDGTLLDHSLILYGTNMGNSNQHQHYDVPHILVGGANGKLKGNRHLAYERKTVPTGNLLLSVLDMYGIQQGQAGRQHGPLAEARLTAQIASDRHAGTRRQMHRIDVRASSCVVALLSRRHGAAAPAATWPTPRMKGDTRGGAQAARAEGRRQRAAGRRRDGAALGGVSRRPRAGRRC